MNDHRKHSEKVPAGQGPDAVIREPLKIGPATPYDFTARNLTAYGGLLPVGTMLEKLGFERLVEECPRHDKTAALAPAMWAAVRA